MQKKIFFLLKVKPVIINKNIKNKEQKTKDSHQKMHFSFDRYKMIRFYFVVKKKKLQILKKYRFSS